MSQGIYVTDCTRTEGTLHVGYETMAPGEGVPQKEVGQLLNALLDLGGVDTPERDSVAAFERAGQWEPEDVQVWVFEGAGEADEDRPQRGRFEVREGWFHALAVGYLSETDFSTLVLSTLD